MKLIKSNIISYFDFVKFFFANVSINKMNRLNFNFNKIFFLYLSIGGYGLLAIFIGHIFGIRCAPGRKNQNHDHNNLFHFASSILFDKVTIIQRIIKIKHNFIVIGFL